MYLRNSAPNIPVFENDQDTYLLSNVLRSAILMNNAEQEALPNFAICSSVIESMGTIVQNVTQQLWSEDLGVVELQEKKIKSSRRMHAMALFSVLRSSNIVCQEADMYYQSVTYNHLMLSWKFYFCIGHQSQWSEFFIECARQLPHNVHAVICRNILDLALDDERKLYSYHILLQSIIWKLFILEDPTIITKESLESHRFDFPFMVPIATSKANNEQVNNDSENELLIVYQTLLNEMFAYAESGINSFKFVKLILHAYKLIFQLMRSVKTCSGEFVTEVFRLNPLLKLCIPHIKLDSFSERENICIHDPCNKLASWNINVNYLIFLVCAFWEETVQLTSQIDSCLNKITPQLPSSDDQETLMDGTFLTKETFGDSNMEIVCLLKSVIQYKYPCANKAAEVLLMHPEILTSDEMLTTLESNIPLLCCWKNCVSLLNAISEMEENEPKHRLLNLLYTVLSHGPIALYNDVLKYIVERWGFNEKFKLAEFSNQLAQFTRKPLTYEEAKALLLPLIVQSPITTLDTVIQQALVQGPEGMGLIQVLKHIPVICNEEVMQPLLDDISGYFFSNQNSVEDLKNMELLIQTFVEVLIEESFLPFDTFLSYFFLPILTFANLKIDLTLSCLNTALRVSNEKNAISVSDNVMTNYLKTCALLLHGSMRFGSGNVKELVIEGLNLMSDHFQADHSLDGETMAALHLQLNQFNPEVFVYMNKFLGRKAYEVLKSSPMKMCDLLWTWCCFTNDDELLQECISQDQFSYEKLLTTLVSLHKHFCMEEWIESTHFIKESCQHLHPSIVPSTLPWKLSDDDFRLYAAVRCLIDCIHFILNQEILAEIYYISSCFTNTVMNLINSQDVQPELLLYIFLDMCHLSSVVEEDILTIFSTFLMGIIKSLESTCRNKSQQDSFKKLFLHAVLGLPDSEEKQSLLKKFE